MILFYLSFSLPFFFHMIHFMFVVVFFFHIIFDIVMVAARFWDPLTFSASSPMFHCSKCGRPYKTKYTLRRHERLECGLPALYKCRICDYRAKHKHSVKQHFEGVHEKKNKFPLEVQLKEWNYPCVVDTHEKLTATIYMIKLN